MSFLSLDGVYQGPGSPWAVIGAGFVTAAVAVLAVRDKLDDSSD
ncbi:MAG TPA: hypothetical protein VGD23_02075 [Sphingomicrobium sp.]